jgi:hypothetical protein
MNNFNSSLHSLFSGKKVKSIFVFFVLSFFLFSFSACSIPFLGDSSQEDSVIYVELEGTVKNDAKDVFSFSDYFLYDDSQKKIAHLDSRTEDLSKFEDKKVVLKGQKKDVPAHESSSLMWLEVVQIAELEYISEKIESQKLGISFFLPENFTGEEKNMRLQVEKDNDSFFTVFLQENTEWKEKFIEEGEKIVIKKFSVYRLVMGNKVKLFFPENNIQIDFWGGDDKQYELYEILETLEFFEKTPEKNEEDEESEKEEKDDEDKDEEGEKEEDAEAQEDATSTLVVEAVEKKLSKIAEEKPKVKKISVYKNFVDAEFLTAEEKKRIIFEYSVDDAKTVELQQVAMYKEGEVKSWDLESGENPRLAGESEIFLMDIDDVKPIVLPENFALYVSTHFDFQIGYPKRMYYRSNGKTENSLASVEWASSPVNAENAEIRLEILEGEISKEEVLENGDVLFPRNEKTHFKLSSLENDAELVQEMKNSFQSSL